MANYFSEPQNEAQGWQKLLAWGSFSIFCVVCALSLLLVGFRMVHFCSMDYDMCVIGFHVGQVVGKLMLPAAAIQLIGIAAGALVYHRHILAKWGAQGGGLALIIMICMLWANVREILIYDLHEAVQTRIMDVSEGLKKEFGQSKGYPEKLPKLNGDGNLSDPYSSEDVLFQYDVFATGFIILSVGPDGLRDLPEREMLSIQPQEIDAKVLMHQYDSSNGVFSKGDIISWVPVAE